MSPDCTSEIRLPRSLRKGSLDELDELDDVDESAALEELEDSMVANSVFRLAASVCAVVVSPLATAFSRFCTSEPKLEDEDDEEDDDVEPLCPRPDVGCQPYPPKEVAASSPAPEVSKVMAGEESDACATRAENVASVAPEVESEESASLERCERCCWRRRMAFDASESTLDIDMVSSFLETGSEDEARRNWSGTGFHRKSS